MTRWAPPGSSDRNPAYCRAVKEETYRTHVMQLVCLLDRDHEGRHAWEYGLHEIEQLARRVKRWPLAVRVDEC